MRVVFLLLPLFIAGSDSKSESDSTDVPYPHEDAAQLGHKKSEEIYKEWGAFWAALIARKNPNVLTAPGLGDPSVKIRVEPGLFEYKVWQASLLGMGAFMSPLELHKAGYQVDVDYKPYADLVIDTTETVEEYYERHEKVFHSAVRDTEAEGGNMLFIGHSPTLDMMVFALKRLGTPRAEHTPYQLSKNLLRVPYCALGAVRDKPWEVISPPCPPSINSSSGRFNWKILLDV